MSAKLGSWLNSREGKLLTPTVRRALLLAEWCDSTEDLALATDADILKLPGLRFRYTGLRAIRTLVPPQVPTAAFDRKQQSMAARFFDKNYKRRR